MNKENKTVPDEYLNHISECYSMVAEWLHKKSLSCKESEYSVHEKASGEYITKKLHIYKDRNHQIAELLPVGAWIIGADGRIDLIGDFDQQILVYLKNDIKTVSSVN